MPILATFSSEELTRRLDASDHPLAETPQLAVLRKVKSALIEANKLGLAGHGIKDVELIVEYDYISPDARVALRVIPDYKFKTPSRT
jgi:hypothetical protein